MALIVQQAGQRTHKYQYRAATAAPIVGEKSIGIRLVWRSFQAVISRSASSKYLGIRRAACGSFLFGGKPMLILHLAAVESHGRIVAEWARVSMSALPP
jgi:hypothetical protein